MKNWLKNLTTWGLKWANTKYSWVSMFVCAFADASFFPLPTPLFFITLSLLNIKCTYKFALTGTMGTVFGALLGFSIGHFAWLNSQGNFTELAQFFFKYIPGFTVELYDKIRNLYIKWDFWILFTAGYTPIPYKFFSISSGVFHLNLFMVLGATFIGQGIRFFLLAYLIIKIGPEIKKIFKRNIKAIAIISSLCLIVIVVLIKIYTY
jgi:membrane protein YqaA with SNARE-associated domain